ncbi:MAG: SDR family oxidoreductase [Acidimicrobiia bacterium]
MVDPVVSPGALVLVTGATGYIGGRLVPVLLAAGYRVRCLVRTPAKLANAPWRDSVEIVAGDVEADCSEAFAGCAAVYYLVHSIGASSDWEARELHAAANVRDAAAAAGVHRIVYLGGLGGDDADATVGPDLSPHLTSRHEVGRILASGPTSVTELRAAVVIGSGSASFEMLRYLVEVLPAMVTPKWVGTRCQPIAVRDVLRYLVDVLSVGATADRVLGIGGPDVLTYREMMDIYAEEAGLSKRRIVPVPVLTPRLSSLWVGLVTPLPVSLARPLVNSLVNEVVVRDAEIESLCPGPRTTYRDAVQLALGRMKAHAIESTWFDAAVGGRASDPIPTDPQWSGGTVLSDVQEAFVDAAPDYVFTFLTRIGGEHGWYSGEWLWALRGAVDKAFGGPGMRRGRRHPQELHVGDAIDFWRVDALEPGHLLRLRAEMRLPGEASIAWELEPEGAGTRIRQIAQFVPRGLVGRAYWYGVAPAHRFVFPGMLRGLIDEVLTESVHS